MQLNGYKIIDRHNRPNTSQRVGLRAIFVNDGVFQDPYEISSVSIFAASANVSPCSVLGSDGLISSSITPLMSFEASGATLTSSENFNASKYIPVPTASGIYKNSDGDFVTVLDGSLSLSGEYNEVPIANSASSVQEYLDVWTVRMINGSNYQTFINEFKLFDDTFFTLTQPLLLKTRNSLSPKRVKLDSKIDLKVTTEITVENKDIDDGIVNIFKDSVITSASMEVVKLNEDPNLPSRVTVSSFADTSATVGVTSDNTLVLNWDTSLLATHAGVAAGTFGNLRGAYTVQVKYTILNQTILSPLFNLIVN